MLPMPPPQPRPPAKRRSRTIWIVVGIVVLLCCGGGIGGGLVIRNAVGKATGPARATVDGFLGHLESGDTAAAYALLCSPVQKLFTRERFDLAVKARSLPARHSIVGVNVSNVNGVVSGRVNARIAYRDGSSETHEFTVVTENGNWLICGQPY